MAVETMDNFDRIVVLSTQQQQGTFPIIQCPNGKTLKIFKLEYWNRRENAGAYGANNIVVGIGATNAAITTVKDICGFQAVAVPVAIVNYIPKNTNDMKAPLFKVDSGQWLNFESTYECAVVVTLLVE